MPRADRECTPFWNWGCGVVAAAAIAKRIDGKFGFLVVDDGVPIRSAS